MINKENENITPEITVSPEKNITTVGHPGLPFNWKLFKSNKNNLLTEPIKILPTEKNKEPELNDEEEAWEQFLLETEQKTTKKEEIIPPKDIELLDVWKKSGYDHLYFMCKRIINNSSSLWFEERNKTMDNRAVYIVDQLNQMNIDYKIIPFNSGWNSKDDFDPSDEKMINIQVFFKSTAETNKTIIFTAHYDIVNKSYENCQDNTASVCNLLDLCKQTSLMTERPQNIYIIFTDGEECGGKGARQICKQIEAGQLGEVENIISLELTAKGSILWAEKERVPVVKIIEEALGKKVNQYRTPYNESMTMRNKGLNSICIGILPEKDIKSLNANSWSDNWRLCHSSTDTFEKSANRKDMDSLVTLLTKIINPPPTIPTTDEQPK